jgi:hypothetical protein
MHQIFQPDLLSDERILWVGKPETSVIFSSFDFFLIPFSLVWFSFAIFWEFTVISSGAPKLFTLWGVPFVIAGLYFVFGRFFYKAWKKTRTYYAVTDKRILVLITTIMGRKLQAAYINSLPNINKSINSKGVGTIKFGNQSPFHISIYENSGLDFFGSMYGAGDSALRFYDIKNVDSVYNLVSELRNNVSI